MNNKNKHIDDDKKIEEMAKQIFGYDDESLLKEFESAEQEANKQTEESLAEGQPQADPTLAALMARVQERNIQPIYKEDYEKRLEAEKSRRKVIRLRGMIRPLLVAAVLVTVMLATTMVTQGKRGYWFWEKFISPGGEKAVLNNIDETGENDRLEADYKVIEQELNIKVIELYYIPEGMEYTELVIDKDVASMKFLYNNKSVRFEISKSSTPVSRASTKDASKYDTIENVFIGEDFIISKNLLEDGQIEYSGDLITKDAQYRFCGIIDESEFRKILEEMQYIN